MNHERQVPTCEALADTDGAVGADAKIDDARPPKITLYVEGDRAIKGSSATRSKTAKKRHMFPKRNWQVATRLR